MNALVRGVISPFGAEPLFAAPQGARDEPTPVLRTGIVDSFAKLCVLPEIDLGRAIAANRTLVSQHAGKSAIPFDALRTKLQIQRRDRGWSKIAITSANAGTGKSTLVANLALAFARANAETVLILDLNQSRPGLAALFATNPHTDISQVLSGELDLTLQGHRLGGKVAMSFSQIRHRGVLNTVDPGRIGAGIEKLATLFQPDLILIDLPEIYAENAVFGLLGQVDAVIAVARENRCRLAELDQCERDIASQTNFAGFVISQA